jgi:hypothetical protein
MTRRLVVVAIAFAPLLALGSCKVSALDVGDDPAETGTDTATPEPDASDEDASRPKTLEQRLLALCAQEEGKVDPYFSAADLSTHLVGTWFLCDKPDMSPLQDGDGTGFRFDATGGWASLAWNEAHTELLPQVGQDYAGKIRCHVLAADAGASADAGTPSRDIDCNDPTPRNGVLVYLDRSYGGPDPERFDFTRDPRGMRVSENDSPLSARYVKVE